MSTYPELSVHRELVLEDEQRVMLLRESRRRFWVILAMLVSMCVLAFMMAGCAETRWLVKCSVTRSLGCS